MSCTFWNMRRRLRKQLGIKSVEQEKVATDLTAVEKPKKRTSKKGGEKSDNRAN